MFSFYNGQKSGIKIIHTINDRIVSPIPGTKKSLVVILPGPMINVFVVDPTGVRKGEDAATMIATPVATGLIPKLTAIGTKIGVTSKTVDVLVQIFVMIITNTRTTNRNRYLFGLLPNIPTTASAIISHAPDSVIATETALIPPRINTVGISIALNASLSEIQPAKSIQ